MNGTRGCGLSGNDKNTFAVLNQRWCLLYVSIKASGIVIKYD